MAYFVIVCVLCSMFSSGWGLFRKKEKFDNVGCDYYTGIGKNGCFTKTYCGSCSSKSRAECASCRNCIYLLDNNTCIPGDYYGPYDKSVSYTAYEYDIPYDFNTPIRRQTDLRYNYMYKII